MGLLSFIKEAGQKLFGHKEAEAAAQTAQQQPDDAAAKAKLEDANQTAGLAITKYIETQQLSASALNVQFDGLTSTVTVAGEAADQATKEKILLCCGNVAGVDKVNDQMTVKTPAAESRYHTVEKGDTLSAVAKVVYGNPNEYNKIFEANRPMLSHPDKIYPGQVLRIPA